jgi:hypothetical protein
MRSRPDRSGRDKGAALTEALSPDDGHRRAVLAGQRRIQRSKLLNGLTKILVAVVICGGLFAAAASGGAFSTTTKGSPPADSSGAAIGGALTALALGLVLALWVVVRYRRNVDRATRDYESGQSASGNAVPGRETSGRFKAEGQLSGRHGLRPGEPVPGEEHPSTMPDYSALAEVEYGGQKGRGGDGVNRSDDPRQGPIE